MQNLVISLRACTMHNSSMFITMLAKLPNLKRKYHTSSGNRQRLKSADALLHRVWFFHLTVCSLNDTCLQVWCSYREPLAHLSSCRLTFKYVGWNYSASKRLKRHCQIWATLVIAALSGFHSLHLPGLHTALTVSNLFKCSPIGSHARLDSSFYFL